MSNGNQLVIDYDKFCRKCKFYSSSLQTVYFVVSTIKNQILLRNARTLYLIPKERKK